MAQSLSQIHLHIVFSTKNRFPFLPTSIEPELHKYMGQLIVDQKSIPFMVNGMSDHIHIYSTLPRTISVADFIEYIKSNSSRWLKMQDKALQNFSWQSGYSAFSIGMSQKDNLIRYIETQKEHHKTKSFEEELIQLLKLYQIEYDERYLWN